MKEPRAKRWLRFQLGCVLWLGGYVAAMIMPTLAPVLGAVSTLGMLLMLWSVAITVRDA